MASQNGGDEIHLRDEDRLPWLETVEPDEPRGPGAARVVAFVLLGLAVLAAIVFAAYRLGQPGPARDAGGALIAAPAGDYKIKPDDPGGLKVGGEGDSAIATSTGAGAGTGSIDPRQVPEKPVAGHRGAGVAAAHGAKVATAAVPASGSRLSASAPMAAPRGSVPGAGSGGSLVQLGAFPTEAAANAAWSALARRFGYVATLGKSVAEADVGGKHVFRLRVNAGSANAAADICGRLKVAGEACFVTSG
ncbi:MAG: SPOR domain-containing protein [Janthinobacterium lividum]